MIQMTLGEENNDTPDFQTDDAEVELHKGLRAAAKTDANPNAATRSIWKEADRIIEDLGFHAKWSSISKGGLDFSDTSSMVDHGIGRQSKYAS